MCCTELSPAVEHIGLLNLKILVLKLTTKDWAARYLNRAKTQYEKQDSK